MQSDQVPGGPFPGRPDVRAIGGATATGGRSREGSPCRSRPRAGCSARRTWLPRGGRSRRRDRARATAGRTPAGSSPIVGERRCPARSAASWRSPRSRAATARRPAPSASAAPAPQRVSTRHQRSAIEPGRDRGVGDDQQGLVEHRLGSTPEDHECERDAEQHRPTPAPVPDDVQDRQKHERYRREALRSCPRWLA